jgi:hypothetical protein
MSLMSKQTCSTMIIQTIKITTSLILLFELYQRGFVLPRIIIFIILLLGFLCEISISDFMVNLVTTLKVSGKPAARSTRDEISPKM